LRGCSNFEVIYFACPSGSRFLDESSLPAIWVAWANYRKD
jgi:hypothetical protein